jgi:hypothetical protein
MAQHTNYWSHSKFGQWLRGTQYPPFAGLDEWDEIHDRAKAAHPIRYWIAEEALDFLQDAVTWPIRKLYDVKYYINNRWVTCTNALVAHPDDIAPGNWRDVGDRFLPCLFNSLVDFVEIELAWMHIAWADKEVAKQYSAPFWACGWFRWRTWRCPQAGLDHLAWSMSLVWGEDEGLDTDDERYGKPTSQAERAKEILDLYTWWTVTRPARPNPDTASGWWDHYEAMEAKYGKGIRSWNKGDKKEKAHSAKVRKIMAKMEAAYEAEDEAMMIRLIKVRHGLWT